MLLVIDALVFGNHWLVSHQFLLALASNPSIFIPIGDPRFGLNMLQFQVFDSKMICFKSCSLCNQRIYLLDNDTHSTHKS